jgi:hypothetical protein
MKLPLLILAGSLMADAIVAVAFVARPRWAPQQIRDYFSGGSTRPAPTAPPTRAAATAQRPAKTPAQRTQLWTELQAADGPTLVARLRAAGFPPHLIRAIVSAHLEAKFESRMGELVGPLRETPFWKNDPFNSGMNSKFWEDYSQIYRERSKLTRELLGSDLYAPDGDEAAAQRRQFGELSQAKVDMIQRINDDYAEMMSQVRAGMQGITLPEDREKLALLEKEKRADLAAFLTPQELEDYEMRSSPVMARLRSTLAVMNPTDDEARVLFRVQQKYSDQINPTGGGTLPLDFMDTRRAAQQQMFDELKGGLGPERYAQYLRAQNSEFQALNRIAQQESIPTDAAIRAFNLRDQFAAESTRIAADPALSLEQERTALKNLGQTARVQLIGTLGQNAGAAYAQTARWVGYIENGSAVTFGPDGQPSSRSVAMPPPPAKKD